jgi:predicted dehydrogenase
MRLLELGFQIQAAGAGLESGARGAEAMMRFKAMVRCGVLAGLVALVTGVGAGQAQQQGALRVAIVGLEHGHVEGFLNALPAHHDVDLVGIADGDPALEAKYQKKYALPPKLFFTSTVAMIEASHPQAVLVYTSIGEHRKVIETAARYGVSVMVEKPLTISLDDALAIRKTAREHHIHVLVNYETTWYASNRAAYDELNAGRLGAVRRVVIHDGHQGPKEIGVPPEFLSWLTDPAQNGAGALYDFGCYGVDLMTWLMHGETPQTVTAVVNHDKPEVYPRVDDDATIVLAYPHAQAVIQASWNWPFGRKDMEVYGATGYAITVGADQVRVRYEHGGDEQLTTAPPLRQAQYDSLNYLAAVLGGRIEDKGDLSALDTNVIVMQILDAARESARTGKTVRLTQLGDE